MLELGRFKPARLGGLVVKKGKKPLTLLGYYVKLLMSGAHDEAEIARICNH
jgi:hypothetical protein